MDKPEFCYFLPDALRELGIRNKVTAWAENRRYEGDIQFRIIYNEAGEVIRLERVEE